MGADGALTKPNSVATAAGRTPENKMEKKLLNAAEIRDKRWGPRQLSG